MSKVIVHGECLVVPSELPKGCKKLKCNDYQIVAKSEVSGNHHVVDVKVGVNFYKKDGILYLKNDVPTDIRCLVKERHDSVTIQPGTYKIDFQKEFDYLDNKERIVSD